jgi:hypothetical protein
MNRSHLRSLPSPASSPNGASGAELAAAESELEPFLVGLLERGARDEESPDYELLEGAIDGTLDPVDVEILESRLVGDPVLQREFEALAEIRDRLRNSRATVGGAASHPRSTGRAAGRRWLHFVAAAILLAAAGLGLRQELKDHSSLAANGVSSRSSQPASRGEVLFADSFEGGSTEHWSN